MSFLMVLSTVGMKKSMEGDKMKYTNKHNLPDYAERWLKADEYDHEENTITASNILQPTQQMILYKRHPDELESDVSDFMAARFGTAMHDSFEKVEIPNSEKEKRLRTFFNGSVVTGKFDLMLDMHEPVQKLVDLKTTSAWSMVFGRRDEEYVKQLSIYRWLAHRNGYNVGENAEIFLVFTDWQSSMAKKGGNYPATRIAKKDIVLMSLEQTEEMISKKLIEIASVEAVASEDLPECTDEELWKDKSGKAKRCGYCSAKKVCAQYKRMKEAGTVAD